MPCERRTEIAPIEKETSHSHIFLVDPIKDAETNTARPAEPNWVDLVEGINRGDQSSMAELFKIFGKGIRFLIARQLGFQEVDDKVHDTFMIVVQAIRRGDLREPKRLTGFVRTVVRRQIAGYIDSRIHGRREEMNIEVSGAIADGRNNAEQSLAFRQKVDLMKSVLRELSEKDREILTRFYLNEQPQDEICEEMDLTETQFRLLKSRAKGRLGMLGQAKLKSDRLAALMRSPGMA